MEGQVKINIGTIRQVTIVDSVDGFDDFGSPQFQRPPDQAPTVSDADVTPTSARVRLPEPGALPTPAVDVRVVTSQAGAQPGGRKEQPARHCSWKDDSSAPRFTPGNLDERRGTIDQLIQSVQPPGDTVSPEQSRRPCSFSDSMAAPSRDTPAHPAMLKKRSLTSGLLRRASTVSLATVKFQNPTLPQSRKPSATFLENRRMGDKTSWKPHLKGEGSPDFGSELPQNQTWRKMRAAKAFSRGTGLVSPGSPAKTAAIGEVLHQLSKKKFSVGKMQKKDFGEQMRFAKNQKLQGKDAFYTAKAPEYDYDAVHNIPMRDMREMLTTTPQNLATDTPEAMNRMHSSGHLYPIPASLLLENLRFIFVLAVVGGVVLGLLTLNLGDPTSEEAIASAHQATPNWEGEGCAGAAVVHGGSVHVAEHGAHAGSEHGAHDEHGRALDEHGGEHGGGHGHGDTGPVDAQSSIGIVIFLVVLTLLFEAFKDWLEELVPDQMEPVLRQIFAEFTVLGFLAMVTYFMIQGSVLSSLSFLIYQDHQHLVHLFENVRRCPADQSRPRRVRASVSHTPPRACAADPLRPLLRDALVPVCCHLADVDLLHGVDQVGPVRAIRAAALALRRNPGGASAAPWRARASRQARAWGHRPHPARRAETGQVQEQRVLTSLCGTPVAQVEAIGRENADEQGIRRQPRSGAVHCGGGGTASAADAGGRQPLLPHRPRREVAGVVPASGGANAAAVRAHSRAILRHPDEPVRGVARLQLRASRLPAAGVLRIGEACDQGRD